MGDGAPARADTEPPTPTRVAARHAITQSAEAILAEEGMPGLTVSAIMRRADISRTAFYRLFDDVYAVVADLVTLLGAELAAASGSWYQGETGSPEVIHGNLLSYARAVAPHGSTLEAIRDAGAFDPDVRELWRRLVRGFADATEAAIRRDQDAGAIDAELDPAGTALALTLMGEQASIALFGRNGTGTPESYADLLTPIWSRTLFLADAG
ncbi:MAG: TetR/AcrR family transcriptional regulator [Acidimicrobiia bacterium]